MPKRIEDIRPADHRVVRSHPPEPNPAPPPPRDRHRVSDISHPKAKERKDTHDQTVIHVQKISSMPLSVPPEKPKKKRRRSGRTLAVVLGILIVLGVGAYVA